MNERLEETKGMIDEALKDENLDSSLKRDLKNELLYLSQPYPGCTWMEEHPEIIEEYCADIIAMLPRSAAEATTA